MKQHSFIVPTALATLLVAGCQSSPQATDSAQIYSSPTDDATAFPAHRTATLWVKGLACPYCVHNIDRQLAEMTGVERVHVDLPTGEVRVALVAKHPATREQLVNAIDDSGFTLDRIEMPQ
ncbi:MAG: heavy-metal-associated domain-containing protein [Planctomycetes bacterium]|nr:heavy-metal-associated domain-containing protein [Planctomycetota bacterium]